MKLKPVLKVENGEVSVEAKAIGERGAMLHMEKLIKNSKNSIILYTAWGGTQSELANADAIKNTGESSPILDIIPSLSTPSTRTKSPPKKNKVSHSTFL